MQFIYTINSIYRMPIISQFSKFEILGDIEHRNN